MINVGIWFDAPIAYTGGLNYVRNVLHALSLVNDGSVRPIIFFATDVPEETLRPFRTLAEVVLTPVLQRRTCPWFIHKVLYKAFGSMAVVNRLMRRHRIDVLSHVWFVYKGRPPMKLIGWIPDFQYLHLPEMFPGLDPANETRMNQSLIAQCDTVILSSQHAYEDFLKVALPQHRDRGRVLRFVSQPQGERVETSLPALREKYGVRDRFFVLPNQFWAHKNHLVVLEAVAALRDEGLKIQVLCTGNTRDYRLSGTPYVDRLRRFIEENALGEQVRILGLIDYADLLGLMRHSVAVINPSLFEGWSSSVEEARSMGKPVVLSRIPVHLEQNPPQGHYFDPADAAGLAAHLRTLWLSREQADRAELEEEARHDLEARTLAFGQAYLQLVQDVLKHESTFRREAAALGSSS
jgi:glycosyltransferase involved in cell wall biosynthesis